jgi:hypothetical protein
MANRKYMDVLTGGIFSPREITRSTVLNGHEDDSLLTFFPKGFIVHDGDRIPLADKLASIKENGVMYRVQGQYGQQPFALQQNTCECKFLNSNEAFAIVAKGGDVTYYWTGEGATESEDEYAKRLGVILAPGAASHGGFKEGEETDEFWEAVGGKTEYLSAKDFGFSPGFEPRLFHCSNAQGYMHMKEVYNFSQQDLFNNDVMALDTYNTIYMWQGLHSNDTEKRNTGKKVEQYISNLTDGRTMETIQMVTLDPGSEPLGFKAFFPEWEESVVDEWFQPDPYTAKLAEIEAAKLAAAEAKKGPAVVYTEPATTGEFDLATLQSSFPEGVDPTKKEQYLSDAVFESTFGMNKDAFNQLKAWKQKDLKKAKNLF